MLSSYSHHPHGAGYGQACDLAEAEPRRDRVEVRKNDLLTRIRNAIGMLRSARDLPGVDLLRLWNGAQLEIDQLEADWSRTVDDYTAQRIRRTLDARALLRRQDGQ